MSEPAPQPVSSPVPAAPEPIRATPIHPPTQPGSRAFRRKESPWPTVLGILAMIFGGFGVLQAAWGIIMTITIALGGNAPFMSSAGPGAPDPAVFNAAMRQHTTQNILANSGIFIAAVLLLIAAIALVRRSPKARPLMLGWALLKIVVGIFSAWVGAMAQRSTFQAMSAQPGMAAMPGALGPMMENFTLLFASLWYAALPVFMLIWFNLGFVRREIAAWASVSRPSSPPPPQRPRPGGIS